jgi:hypothetical protein
MTVIVIPSDAQEASKKPGATLNYRVPRTADGKPDLQGVWTNASLTTLERNSKYKSLVLSKQEVAALAYEHPANVRQRTDDGLGLHEGLLDGSDLQRGRGYNAFWIDQGTMFGLVNGEYRSSWIVDPADGKIPYNEQGRALLAKRRNSFDGPEGRPLGERCLAVGNRVGPPMVNGAYNNNYQIVQTADYVVISVEMIQHARIIALNHKHIAANVRPLFGNSIGWWDGDTLVVETTNFHPVHSQSGNPAYLTEKGKVIERLTRVSPTQILYEFTVEDPTFYSRPWRGEMSLTASKDRIYEYACHEGNYAMTGGLAGAREYERQGKAVPETLGSGE